MAPLEAAQAAEASTTASTPAVAVEAEELEQLETRLVALCPDQAEWLQASFQRAGAPETPKTAAPSSDSEGEGEGDRFGTSGAARDGGSGSSTGAESGDEQAEAEDKSQARVGAKKMESGGTTCGEAELVFLSRAMGRLVDVANREPSSAKRQLFLVVRCHRCLQHTRGGDKNDYELALPRRQWQWLEAVQERSKHPTVGKTLRIIVDFYRPICDKDPKFTRAIFSEM